MALSDDFIKGKRSITVLLAHDFGHEADGRHLQFRFLLEHMDFENCHHLLNSFNDAPEIFAHNHNKRYLEEISKLVCLLELNQRQ